MGHRALRSVAGVKLLVLLVACGDEVMEPEPPRPTAISISPSAVELAFIGETETFTATVTDQYGAALPEPVTWHSDAPEVFSVSSNGVVVAVANGTGTLTVIAGQLTATASVSVQQVPTVVEAVSGDGQEGLVVVELVDPVVVRVLDAGQAPVEGVALRFTPAEGSGTVDPDSATTDTNGEARTTWTLGSTEGTHSLAASVEVGPSVEITASALPDGGICDRSPAVVDEIKRELGHRDCTEVKWDQLRWVREMYVGKFSVYDPGEVIQALKPGDLAGLTGLEWLRIHHTNIRQLPTGLFSDLVGLKNLDMGFNSLAELQSGVFSSLVSLQQLSLRNNQLTALPAGVFDEVSDLRILRMNENALTELRDSVFSSLGQLRQLDLTRNRIAALPENVFSGLSKLSSLKLAINQIEALPEGIFSPLSEVTVLYLGHNPIEDLPPVFSDLHNLIDLDLRRIQLDELTAGTLAGLSSLTRLNASGNELTRLQSGVFSELGSLRALYLGENPLRELAPGVFSGLSNLEVLQLYNNELTNLPPRIFDGLTVLNNLWLGGERLTGLPAGVFDGLSGLEKLVVQGPRFSEMPQGISGLSNLKTLSISHIRMAGLRPGSFAGLMQLRQLILSDARGPSSELADGVFQELSGLQRLTIYKGLVGISSGAFAGLTNLFELVLSYNELKTLPADVLAELSQIYMLLLEHNQLAELPPNLLSGASNLWWLRLNHNQLKQLPDSMFVGFRRLKSVWLNDNPGAPFEIPVQLVRTDTTDLSAPGPASIAFRIPDGAPNELQLELEAQNGSLSPIHAVIARGETESNPITVTRDTNHHGPVTVRLVATSPRRFDCGLSSRSDCYAGFDFIPDTLITVFK